jgi:hypothetical protein
MPKSAPNRPLYVRDDLSSHVALAIVLLHKHCMHDYMSCCMLTAYRFETIMEAKIL